jgi:hypothetical protein
MKTTNDTKLDALTASVADIEQTLGDLVRTFNGFNAGQAAIIGGQKITNRLLDTIVQMISTDGESEGAADLLRAVLTTTQELLKLVRAIPHQVEASVALHTTGEIIPPAKL